MSLIIITLIGAALSTLVALMALLKSPKSKLHRWLFAFILASCFWITAVNLHGIFETEVAVWLLRMSFFSVGVAAFCMLQFVRSFAVRSSEARYKIDELGVLLAVLVLSVTPYNIASVTPEGATGYLIASRGPAYPIVIGLILMLIVKAFVILLRQRKRTRGHVRAQLTIVFWGLLVGTIIGVTSNVILPNLVKNTFPSRFAFLAVVIWTIVLIYAIVKHHFLDVRLAVMRGVGYALALITIALIYIALIVFITQIVLVDASGIQTGFYLYSVILAVITASTFHPLRLFFDRVTKRIFFRDSYDSGEVINKLSAIFTRTVELRELVGQTLYQIFSATKPEFIWMIIIPEDKKADYIIDKIGKTKLDSADLSHLIEKLPDTKLIIGDEVEIEHPVLARSMSKVDIALITRLETSNESVGFMLFGYKNSGSVFSSQDIELIRIATDGLAVSAQNALRFDEIRNFNTTLQQRIGEATKELRASNAQLQRLDEAKDEFVSMASHQLRTPLTSVKGYISMVLEGDVGKITAMQRKLLGEAFTSSERMVHLINDFLNVSRLQTGKFMLEQHAIDLSKVITQEVESLQTTAKARDLTLRYRAPSYFPILQIDEGKIRQVLMNFIDNAIYYSHEHTTIAIDLAIDGGDAIVKVHDTGIGVPRSEQAHLFTKFFRATNARKQRPDGTGVGLFLAKKVIVAHGGTILFESKEDEGSMFGFRLPIKKLSTTPSEDTNKLNK